MAAKTSAAVPDPDELVVAYVRIRRQDRDRIRAWARAHGLTMAQAWALAAPHGVAYLETWGATTAPERTNS